MLAGTDESIMSQLLVFFYIIFKFILFKFNMFLFPFRAILLQLQVILFQEQIFKRLSLEVDSCQKYEDLIQKYLVQRI